MGTPHAYFQRKFVPLAEAKIGVMTHAFNYGTAVFEGIRGNWNGDDEQIYVFRLEDHFRRMRKNCRILKIDFPYSDEELVDITVRLVAMCGYNEDIYLRPIAYKSSEVVGVRLHNLESDFLIYVTPLRGLSGHREGRPLLHLDLATGGGHRHPGPGQDQRPLRQLLPGQDRGRRERLRRGHHAERGRPRVRGQRREHLHRRERPPHHAGRLLQRADGHHARHGDHPGPR